MSGSSVVDQNEPPRALAWYEQGLVPLEMECRMALFKYRKPIKCSKPEAELMNTLLTFPMWIMGI